MTGVRLGEWQLSTDRDCDQSKYKERCSEPYQDFIVEEAFPHENYDPNNANQHNDIAILRLTEKITKFSLFITPICLPIEDSIRYKNFTEKNMIVTGWGSASSFSKKDIKQKSDLKGVDTVKCQQKYTSLGQTITSKQICAGGDFSRDTCIGDR